MVDELRSILLKIVDCHEALAVENIALKAVLQSAEPRPGEPSLKTQVAELLEDIAGSSVHQFYDTLRQDIHQAAHDEELNELLKRFPPTGEPN
jgi:hypothetical protein